MKIDLVLSLPLPQAQPRWSLALSESQTIKEAKAVEVSAVPKWALGAPGFCCLRAAAMLGVQPGGIGGHP